ncbi:MAG: O-antigen ligase family protein [Candidatus Coatesbacteria bacterium]
MTARALVIEAEELTLFSRRVMAKLSWLCLLTLAGILPIVFWTRTDDTVRTAQWIFFWTVAAVGLGAGWVSGLRVGCAGPLRVPLLAYGTAVLLLPAAAFRFSTGLADGLGVAAGVASALLAAWWLRDPKRFRAFATALLLVHLAVSFYGFIQYMGADPMRWAYQYGGMRPFATLGNPNFLAGHFATLLPWAAVMFLAAPGPVSKIPWLLVTMVWALLVLVAQTRGAWIAVGVSMAWIGWRTWSGGREWFAAQRSWLAAFVVLVILIAVGASARNPELSARIADFVPHDFGQIAKRYTAARAALFMWRDRPVTGFGGGCFKHGFGKYMAKAMPPEEIRQFMHTYSEEYAHCDYLQLIAETGVIGFGLFAWVLVCAVRLLLLRTRDDWAARILLGGGIALGIHAAFNLPLHIGPTTFLCWAGIGLAAVLSSPRTETPVAWAGPAAWSRPVALIAVITVGTLAVLQFAASAYSRVGMDYRNVGDWRISLAAYERGLRVNWDDRREAFYVASMRGQIGDLDTAARMFELEIRRNPYYMDGFTNYGSVLGMQKRIKEAEAPFRRAIELNPAYADAFANLGVALLELGRFPEAESVFQQAVALDPTSAQGRQGLELARARRRP